jgi:hypothetical protein
MAAGKHGSSEFTFSIDDAPGGSPTTMTNYILTIGGCQDRERDCSRRTRSGTRGQEMLATGFAKVPAITVTGYFDDTATTGPHTVFQVKAADRSPQAATRTVAMGSATRRPSAAKRSWRRTKCSARTAT